MISCARQFLETMSTMLKILSLNYEFPPIGGGGGNAHRHILREFTRFQDMHVTLITTTIQPDPFTETLSPNVQIHFLPIKKQDLFFWRRSEVIRYLAIHHGFLGEHLKTNSYDLCHVFFGFPSGLLAFLRRKTLPYLVSVRGSDVPGYNRRFSLDYVFLRPILNRIYRSARAVVANSRGLQDLFQRQFPRLTAQVIPNGVDTTLFAPVSRPIPSEFTLVTLARLIPRKGIDLLLRACRILQQNGFAFQCHIVGDGPEEENLKKLSRELGISERITFHGRMERESVARFLPQCDLFVLPSYAEGMSNAALEAMACGLPLVLTDTGGSRELIDGNGKIVAIGESLLLAATLMDLLSQPQQLREMGDQSRIRAEQYSWRTVAQQYHDLYVRLCHD
ncbi:MAG: glycosyltransferase family 4 protein [Candidatus Omnitrophota bacterium]|jgi:glycosyltransferase involved in cell wall biosynthesis|nr:MAG: glycosyltransferase family 4 protein [Candidatus Omnitrophota bacterium]